MDNQILICFFLILVIGTYCKNVRVIGGEDSTVEEFPFIVSIRMLDTNSLICAGSILTKKYILTAAHCVFKKEEYYPKLQVHVGNSNLSQISKSIHTITKYYIHPEFEGRIISSGDTHNDIAVVKIKKSISFNNRQKKAELPTQNIVYGSEATICGWGIISYPLGKYSDTLQKTTVKILSPTDCSRNFPHPLLKDQICTYMEGKGAATGDSGGPVVSNGKLIGVISYSIPWIKGSPQIQSNVYKHLNFIKAIIK